MDFQVGNRVYCDRLEQRKNNECGTLLYQKTVDCVNTNSKGTQKELILSDYQSKSFISDANNNGSSNAIFGITKYWVDEYSGVNIGDKKEISLFYAKTYPKSLIE